MFFIFRTGFPVIFDLLKIQTTTSLKEDFTHVLNSIVFYSLEYHDEAKAAQGSEKRPLRSFYADLGYPQSLSGVQKEG